jgi:uncharacterized protein DUF6647
VVRLAAVWIACSFALGVVAGFAQTSEDLEAVVRQLFATIETLSDYRAPRDLPPVFQVPQHLLEAKVCDQPCNVSAAYIPREGIYLAANLDPIRDPLDRAALLHELVHSLQQGHAKFAHLSGCRRERAKEQEAYAIQNAYLAALGIERRVTFFDSEFDCDGDSSR